jgi:hypothetical protein
MTNTFIDRMNPVGEKTKKWLENIGTYLAKEGLKAGVEVAKKTATKWIMQHYGFDIGWETLAKLRGH